MDLSNDPHSVELGNATTEKTLPDWPALAGRAIGDISRIVEAEIRLFEIGLRETIKAEIDRAMFAMMAMAAFIWGGICGFAAIIIGLRDVLGHWWMSFAVVCGLAFLIAGALWVIMVVRRPESIAKPKSSS
ncbi:MAG: phage holin family protein [Candidatus Binataceae bacterium]